MQFMLCIRFRHSLLNNSIYFTRVLSKHLIFLALQITKEMFAVAVLAHVRCTCIYVCVRPQDPGAQCYPDMLDISSMSCFLTKTTSKSPIYDRSCHTL